MKRDDILMNATRDYLLAHTDLAEPISIEEMKKVVKVLEEMDRDLPTSKRIPDYKKAIAFREAGGSFWNVHRLTFNFNKDGWLHERTLYTYKDKAEAEAMARALNAADRTTDVYIATDLVWG